MERKNRKRSKITSVRPGEILTVSKILAKSDCRSLISDFCAEELADCDSMIIIFVDKENYVRTWSNQMARSKVNWLIDVAKMTNLMVQFRTDEDDDDAGGI